MKKIRVAYVVPHLHTPSGWRSMCTGIIRAMSRKVEPVLVVSEEDALTAQQLFPEVERVILPVVQGLWLRTPRAWGRLAHTWQQLSAHPPSVDLVHSLEAYPTGLIGHQIASAAKVPHIISTAGTYAVRAYDVSVVDRFVYGRILRHTRQICPISEGTAVQILKRYPEIRNQEKLHVVLLGTEYTQIVARDTAVHHKQPDNPVLLSVGAVKPRKGYHVSLQVFARIQQEMPDASYFIIGSTDDRAYYESLQDYVRQERLTAVHFMGKVPADVLQKTYQNASLFILAPQAGAYGFEGFGLVYIEAGAYGLPVVGTRTGGVPDAIKENETGFLANEGDVDSLTEAALRLLRDKALAQRMGRENRDWAEFLTWDKYTLEQQSLYERALS